MSSFARLTSASRTTPLTSALGLALVKLLAAVTLGHRIGWQDYWWDEHVTLMFTRIGWHELLVENWGTDTHRPFYYALQKGWNALAGESATATRSLPAALHLLLVPLFYATARQIGGPRFALTAALILVTAPMFVNQGREIRMYALMNLCLTAALFCAVALAGRFAAGRTGTDRGGVALWTGLALSLAAAFHAHSIAIFVALLFGLWGLACVALRLYPAAILRPAAGSGLLYLILIAPALLPFFGHYGSTLGTGFWVPEPSADYVYGQFTAAYPFPKWTKPAFLALFLLGLWRLRGRRDILLLLLVLVVGLPLVTLLVSVSKPIFMTRVIGWSSLVATLVLAAGISQLPTAVRPVALAAVIAAQAVALNAFYPAAPERPPLADFSDSFDRFDPARDAVLIVDQKNEAPLRWYHPELFAGRAYAVSPSDRHGNVIDRAFLSRLIPLADAPATRIDGERLFVLVDKKSTTPQSGLLTAVDALVAGRPHLAALMNPSFALHVYGAPGS